VAVKTGGQQFGRHQQLYAMAQIAKQIISLV